jgi:uncharacterized protein
VYFSVRDLEARKVGFDLAFQPGEIDFGDEKLRQTGALTAAGSAELMGATHEIRVQGRVSVRVTADCDRCLEDAVFSVSQDFDLFYRPAPEAGEGPEKELDEGASEVAFYEGEGLDLKDILKEQVLLALPMQRVCREDCRGICPVCGENRNQSDCGCQVRPGDARWEALKSWKHQVN